MVVITTSGRTSKAACVLAIDCANTLLLYVTGPGEVMSDRITRHILSTATASSLSNIMCIGK